MYETIIKDGKEYKLVPVKKERKNKVLFTLTMPRNNAWNGKWTGDGKCYCISKSLRGISKELKEGNYQFDFEDGLVANVNVKFVTPSEAKAAMKKSAGFCGYDWMWVELYNTGKLTPTSTAKTNAMKEAIELLEF
jgi:hypothetical protein